MEMWAEEEGDCHRVCVRDNGVGFGPRHADKRCMVFERMHREQDFVGTGTAR
ncbi:hypothetical protein [Deinococcus hopiensis]|uniref:hypothetical protein n=1 Tax=Deinococcus hopiensis TaxID=309885 RepID=UPI001482EA1E|nr:hypothetical protein [Deinococcus hopiensis]